MMWLTITNTFREESGALEITSLFWNPALRLIMLIDDVNSSQLGEAQ